MQFRFNPFAGRHKIFSWWFGLKLGIITALLVGWWVQARSKQHRPAGEAAPVDIPLPEAPDTSPRPAVADDLRKVKGVGPKIQAVLWATGLQTYAQLAAAAPAQLRQILAEANIRSADPTTWPEQAALAARAEWDQLTALQATLNRGRR